MKWLDTTNSDDVDTVQANFWTRLRADLHSGAFWSDRIKQVRDQPVERLRIAIENLPLPGAFREAAIATRGLIKAKRKLKEGHQDELALLYWLAAVESFGLPFSQHLQQPGLNVMMSVPGHALKALSFTYSQLGYQRLPLLNKTDATWFVACWGEPQTHTTLNALHADLWHRYEKAEELRQQRQLSDLLGRI